MPDTGNYYIGLTVHTFNDLICDFIEKVSVCNILHFYPLEGSIGLFDFFNPPEVLYENYEIQHISVLNKASSNCVHEADQKVRRYSRTPLAIHNDVFEWNDQTSLTPLDGKAFKSYKLWDETRTAGSKNNCFNTTYFSIRSFRQKLEMKNKTQIFNRLQIICPKQTVKLDHIVIETLSFNSTKQGQCVQSCQELFSLLSPEFKILLQECFFWFKIVFRFFARDLILLHIFSSMNSRKLQQSKFTYSKAHSI